MPQSSSLAITVDTIFINSDDQNSKRNFIFIENTGRSGESQNCANPEHPFDHFWSNCIQSRQSWDIQPETKKYPHRI
jgi:hypothetical protein